MKRYRTTKQFSLDGKGRPEINYMVEVKPSMFTRWEGVRMFITKIAALDHIKKLKSGQSR